MKLPLQVPRGMQLPQPGQPGLQMERTYRPAHNIERLRYWGVRGSTTAASPSPAGNLRVKISALPAGNEREYLID